MVSKSVILLNDIKCIYRTVWYKNQNPNELKGTRTWGRFFVRKRLLISEQILQRKSYKKSFHNKNSVLDIHVLPGFNPHYFLQMLGLHENQEKDIDRQILGVVDPVIKVLDCRVRFDSDLRKERLLRLLSLVRWERSLVVTQQLIPVWRLVRL